MEEALEEEDGDWKKKWTLFAAPPLIFDHCFCKKRVRNHSLEIRVRERVKKVEEAHDGILHFCSQFLFFLI